MDKQANESLRHIWHAQVRQLAARNPRLARQLWQNRQVYFSRFVDAYRQVANLPRKIRRKYLRQLATTIVGAAMLLALGVRGIPTHAAPMATITVDGAVCTLEEAIDSANNDDAAGNGCLDGNGADVLELQVDANLASVLPFITSEITLNGNGHTIDGGDSYQVFYVAPTGTLTVNEVIITGGAAPGDIGGGINNNGTITINNSTLTGNSAEWGGGLYNFGSMVLNNSTVSGNSAGSKGGGLYNTGTLTLNNSTITGNTALEGGGIYNYRADLILNRSLISGNSATVGLAEVHNGGTGTVFTNNFNVVGYGNSSRSNISLGASDFVPLGALNTVLDTNLTDNGGLTPTHALFYGSPAIDIVPTGDSGAYDQRGYARDMDGDAIMSSHEGDAGAFEYTLPSSSAEVRINGTECDLADAIIVANTNNPYGTCSATGNLGADTIVLLKNIVLPGTLPDVTSEITLYGNGHYLSGDNTYQVLVTQSSGNLTLNHITLKDGYSSYNGGCIKNDGLLTLNISLVTGCYTPFSGGGIRNDGNLVLNDSVVSNNNAGYYGGGIFNNGTVTLNHSQLSGNTANLYWGGGISSNSSLTIKYSIVSNNQAAGGGGGIHLGSGNLIMRGSMISSNTTVGYGGGIASYGSSVLIENSTITQNTAGNSGGGIAGVATLNNSTITGNLANRGGGLFLPGGTTTLHRSLISGNNATSTGNEIYGPVTANDYNVIGYNNSPRSTNFTPGANDIIPTASIYLADILDPTLADNGGPTPTHAIIAGSPAIDVTSSGCPTIDQRGAVRSYGTGCDAGAVEAREILTWGDCTSGPVLSGSYDFNFLASGHIFTVDINSASDLTCITIEEMGPGAGHLLGTSAIKNSNNWWHIKGNNTTPFDLNLTIPAGFHPSLGDKVCRWNGDTWDCGADSMTTTHITRNHVTVFSDWATSIETPTAITLQQLQASPQTRSGWLAALVGLVTLGLGMLGLRKKN
ncbi:MAG: hypothetical protein H6636_07560 [Anaerolineales bacterium]|nr:hypothetical protein [Anaerolineales bacterium]